MNTSVIDNSPPPLIGGKLVAGTLLLAMANFLAILDTTIANVSVANIAGSLGTSTSQGTYVITSYAVAEAISVPLTGWLASRFGSMRVFVTCFVLFGVFSALCGVATSMNMLVVFRVLLGFCGGPMMPLSQTLMMRIYPKNKNHVAIGIWSMTTLIAPILGPILGGILCDQYSWHYIFLMKAPFAIIAGIMCWNMLRQYETSSKKLHIDRVGLGLLIISVAALQIMLDEGKDNDWFSSHEIITLAIIAIIGFSSFLIWELTEKAPIVNLKVFRHRGYSVSMVALFLGYGAFFGTAVLTPMWLQQNMGYTATIAGYATASMGILAVLVAPMAANLTTKLDPRALTCFGILWLGGWTFYRSFGAMDMTFSQISLPQLFEGLGMPMFFVSLTALALGSVNENEMESAAGLMNFIRTMGGAIATSTVNTSWDDQIRYIHAELSGLTDSMGIATNNMINSGVNSDLSRVIIDNVLYGQSVMMATNKIFMVIAAIFAFAAFVIWFAPKPLRVADTSAVH
jgi:DHA2 family multidrug resistance protein